MPSSKKTEPRRLAIGVVGIGRIGRQHALNALHAVHRTKLLCACSPAPADLEWADEHLIPYGVNVYPSFDEMIAEPGLEAVIIASTTKLHYEQVAACIKRGLHVLCEKPLAMNVAESQAIVSLAAEQPAHARLKVMTAFSRRFDDSYLRAAAAVRAGRIGQPVVVRSETRDRYDDSDFYDRYIMQNPGIFIDTGVHDIDLTFAFLGDGLRPKSCHAVGTVARHRKLARIGDVDNATGCVEWYAPEGKVPPISYYFFSRIMHHGFDNPTEIIGTDGALKINLHPHRDLLVHADGAGIANDVMPDFYERYEKAFVTELRVFADAVLDGNELPYQLDVAVKGMDIAAALQESLRTGKKIEWDEEGNRIPSSNSPDVKSRI